MRQISCRITTPQVVDMSKKVTRRLGWWDLQAGEHLMTVVQGQGLQKGQKVKRLREVEVVGVNKEPLDNITPEEVILEGFPDMSPKDFVEMFCEANKHKNCTPETEVNRIRWEYCHPEFSIEQEQEHWEKEIAPYNNRRKIRFETAVELRGRIPLEDQPITVVQKISYLLMKLQGEANPYASKNYVCGRCRESRSWSSVCYECLRDELSDLEYQKGEKIDE